MSEVISIPLKKGFHSDLVKPILKYIDYVGHYGSSNNYHAQLNEIQKLRLLCIENCKELDPKSLSFYQRYADEIISLDLKLPLAENQIRIRFKWQDAFPSGRIKKVPTLVVASGAYEKACVLFNLAALSVAVAQQQNLQNDEGLKTSAKLFQQASGIYTHLQATTRLTFQDTDCTNDLHPDCLGALASLTLARAQDIFVKKAMQDAMKPSLVAKLSQQCALLYEETCKQLQADFLKIILNKNWAPMCNVKRGGFQALAYFYEGKACNANKNYAEGLSRFRQAKDTMSKLKASCPIKPFPFTDEHKLIEMEVTKAEKENSFIFHTGAPDYKKLPEIEKAVLAKPTPVENVKFSPDTTELLDRLLPWTVQQAAMRCKEQGVATKQKEIAKLKEASRNLNSVLVTLNLPASLEDMVGNKMPKSLAEKAATIRSLGGFQHMERLVGDLPSLVQKCKNILDFCDRALMEEEMEDRKLRMAAGNHRTASELLNRSFKDEVRSHRGVVTEAGHADAIVRQKLAPHKNNIQLLSENDNDIERGLPENKITKTPDLAGKKFIGELIALMKQVEQVKTERKGIEEKLKATDIDAASKFMSSFRKNGALYEETASREELNSVFGALVESAAKNISSQERIVKQIQASTQELNQYKSQNDLSNPARDSKLKEMATAYDCYMDLHAATKEGNKFYTDFILILEKFQAKVSHYCTERAEEKAELMSMMSSMPQQQQQSFSVAFPSQQHAFSTQTLYSALPQSSVIVGNRPAASSAYYHGGVSFNPYTSYMRN